MSTPDPAPPAQPSTARPKRRPGLVVLAIATFAVILIGTLWWFSHARNAQASRAGAGGRGRMRYMTGGPLPVVVQAAVKGDINIYLDGLGTVTPLANVTLRTQISGLLMRVAFQEGQMVNRGDLLAVIDPRPYEVALQQAEGQLLQAQAQLKEAQIDLVRYQTLSQQDSIAQQTVDTQSALVTQDQGLVQTDEAAIASAKLNLTYCHITAPVAGRVGLRQVDPGNYVTPSDTNGLVVLTQVKPITVIFTLPEDNVPAVTVRVHAGATIPTDAYDRTETTKLASGTLSTIDNQVDPTTGTFKLRALFANADESLFPNQFVNIRMLLNVDRGATVISTSAVERGQNGTFVYVVKFDPDAGPPTVTAQPVVLGDTEGERVAVISGLAVGDRVVVDGADKLKDGARVIVQRPAGAGRQGGAGTGGHRHHPSGADGSGTQQ